MVREVMAERECHPLLFIDIAVPRDVHPDVREIDGVHLYDIDDLQALSNASLRARMKEVVSVEAMVEEEVTRFLDWAHSLKVVPTVAALRRQAEEIRAGELARTLRHLPTLTEEEK
jgi:glutamyl-tRNA reductase